MCLYDFINPLSLGVSYNYLACSEGMLNEHFLGYKSYYIVVYVFMIPILDLPALPIFIIQKNSHKQSSNCT